MEMDAETDAALIAASEPRPRLFRRDLRPSRDGSVSLPRAAGRAGRRRHAARRGISDRVEKRATYDVTRPNARPWLYGIATHFRRSTAAAEVRHVHATARLHARRDVTTDATDDLVDQLDRQLWPRLAARVARLPAGERDALLLYRGGKASATTTSRSRSGCRSERCGSRLNRARLTFRELRAPIGRPE